MTNPFVPASENVSPALPPGVLVDGDLDREDPRFAHMWYAPPPQKTHGQQQESRLLQYLMQGYDRQVRPVVNVTNTVTIHVGITLTQIFDMVSTTSCSPSSDHNKHQKDGAHLPDCLFKRRRSVCASLPRKVLGPEQTCGSGAIHNGHDVGDRMRASEGLNFSAPLFCPATVSAKNVCLYKTVPWEETSESRNALIWAVLRRPKTTIIGKSSPSAATRRVKGRYLAESRGEMRVRAPVRVSPSCVQGYKGKTQSIPYLRRTASPDRPVRVCPTFARHWFSLPPVLVRGHFFRAPNANFPHFVLRGEIGLGPLFPRGFVCLLCAFLLHFKLRYEG